MVNLGELVWRLGLVLARFNFVVIALAAGQRQPARGPRSGQPGIVRAFHLCGLSQLLNLGQKLDQRSGQAVGPAGFMLALHGGALDA